MFWETLWDTIWFIFLILAAFAYAVALVAIVVDLFRDRKLSGWGKAVWIIFLIIFPILTAVVYLIARGGSMEEREYRAEVNSARDARIAFENAASTLTPSEEITRAQQLLDDGIVDRAEFDVLKGHALARASAHVGA